MNQIEIGEVVVCGTGQAGTFICETSTLACVLLRNGDIWYGKHGEMIRPQSQEHLDACPIEVDRFKDR